jgi:hypothetical protein
MTVPVHLRVLLVVVLCSAAFVLSALYEDIFLPEWQTHVVVGSGIADTYRVPSTTEVVLRIATALIALITSAAYVARVVADHKILKGAAASVACALVVVLVLQIVIARKLGVGYVPKAFNVTSWVAVSALIGAGASWASAALWPNPSLERTREI